MKNFEQFCISAFVAAFAAVACYYLIEESDFWIFGFEQIIAAVVGGVVAFVLMARYYRMGNKEKLKNANVDKIDKKAEKAVASFDWDYDISSKTLSISGQGHMPQDWHPWGNVRVRNIVIMDGVLSISPGTFRNLNTDHDLKIEFGNTLKYVGDSAFRSQPISGISVFPDTLVSIGANVFTCRAGTLCFKSQNPPSISDRALRYSEKIIIPMGCLKRYVSSSKEWQDLANLITEKDVSLMHSSLEMEAIDAENKRQEEERRKAEKERKKVENERKAEEERINVESRRKAEEERQKAEEEEYMARIEEELRKQMGL